MPQLLIKFSVLLLLCGAISYGLHITILPFGSEGEIRDLIDFSYKFNFGITFLFTSTIILVGKNLKDYIGFIFLAGGFIKLGIFLYLIDSLGFPVNREVFMHFFIPYVICISLEIYYILKILNGYNSQNDK